MIKCNKLVKKYEMGENIVYALKDVNLQINEGEFVSVTGKSGSGKSTLINMLSGIDYPNSGDIYYNQTKITELNEDQLTIFRRENIGFVFQSYNLIPELNVRENIIFPVLLLKKKVDQKYFDDLVNDLELKDRLEHLPSELSGGQMQRVAIARAMIHKPAVLFCDEPTGNLDSVSSKNVINSILQLKEKFNQTLVIVTHDEELAKKADRIINIKDGEII